MPTANPRINVTLSVSLDQLVTRLAAHQRVSKSQVFRELLETAEPALQRAATLMDAASTASREVLSGLAHRLTRDQEAAEDSAAVLIGRLDRVTADLVSQAEAIQGKRPARRARGGGVPHPAPYATSPHAKDPPASNRGVKSPSQRGSRRKDSLPETSRRSRR